MTDFSKKEWKPVESAPWQKVLWVKNELMKEPILASRGYISEFTGMVCKDNLLFTSVYTPHRFFPMPPGRLVCPTVWTEYKSGEEVLDNADAE